MQGGLAISREARPEDAELDALRRQEATLRHSLLLANTEREEALKQRDMAQESEKEARQLYEVARGEKLEAVGALKELEKQHRVATVTAQEEAASLRHQLEEARKEVTQGSKTSEALQSENARLANELGAAKSSGPMHREFKTLSTVAVTSIQETRSQLNKIEALVRGLYTGPAPDFEDE